MCCAVSCRSHRRKKCMRPGPVTRNGFLNFLREFRKHKCGLSAVQVAIEGGKVWRCMRPKEKCKYIHMARKATKRRRHRRC